jgi:hypothetical protein
MQVEFVDRFGNAVSKNGEPKYDENAHLAWYRGEQPAEPIRRVRLENQFGKFDIMTGPGYGLLVPTQKVEPGSAFPKTLDHYKVYHVVDPGPVPQKSIRLGLSDQFGPSETQLGLPGYFAVPVAKQHGTKDYAIINTVAHLLIFNIDRRKVEKKITLSNQFSRDTTVNVVSSVMLAVPSLKHDWKPA